MSKDSTNRVITSSRLVSKSDKALVKSATVIIDERNSIAVAAAANATVNDSAKCGAPIIAYRPFAFCFCFVN
jgi:stage III sporulation protein SpoIIIAA